MMVSLRKLRLIKVNAQKVCEQIVEKTNVIQLDLLCNNLHSKPEIPMQCTNCRLYFSDSTTKSWEGLQTSDF